MKGIKVDFFGGDKQETMRLYEAILSDANDYGLMVIFHGCTLPRGWERMYPNYLGSEAVLASENIYFQQHFCDQEAVNAATHPFIRNSVGCMEFGGTFLNKRLNKHNDGGNTRRTSDVFQLATSILFQNPIQNFAITPNNLVDAPEECIEFLRNVPTEWDETRFIDGYPGKYVVIARRKGNKWYIAGVNATDKPINLNIRLPELSGLELSVLSDSYTKDKLKRNKKGNVQQKTTAFDFLLNHKTIISKDGKLSSSILPNGGVVIEAIKQGRNPILPGFHADPEILYSKKTGKYYIYSTTDGTPGWSGKDFRCFSSTNMSDWKDEGIILDLASEQVPWANGNAWAPAIEEKYFDGAYKYYFYYSGNPIAGGGKQIGVAISDNPVGPYTDYGKPIITSSPVGYGQQIDVDVFTDPVSGKSYLYWGNGYMAGAELNDDMVSIVDSTLTVMTPKGGSLKTHEYREAPYVFYHDGLYYFMWSVDDTGSANYHVAYGTSDNPLGPIKVAKCPVVLSQRPEQQIYGTGHNSVISIPNTDDYWIVYHRINPNFIESDSPGTHREVCIDRMTIDPDKTINPIIPSK